MHENIIVSTVRKGGTLIIYGMLFEQITIMTDITSCPGLPYSFGKLLSCWLLSRILNMKRCNTILTVFCIVEKSGLLFSVKRAKPTWKFRILHRGKLRYLYTKKEK